MNGKSALIIASIFVFSVIVQLKGITNPLLDFHAWRQTQTAMTARNYYENGFKFFYQQIDWAGADSNLRAGTEFPIYSYGVAILYKIFGQHDFLGRFLAVFFSALASVYLFFLLSKYIDSRSSFISSLIFSVIPVKIYFTRTFQPESLMIFSTIAGIYYFASYLENTENKKRLIISCLLISVAPLVKLPSLYILLPLVWLAWQKFGRGIFERADVWFFFIFIFLSVCLWYAYARTGVGVLPLNFSEFTQAAAILAKPGYWSRQFLSRFVELTSTYSGLIFLAAGFWFVVIKRRVQFLAVWFLSVLIYTILIGEYGYVHQYTTLPFAPINAAFIGSGIVYAWDKYRSSQTSRIILVILVLAIPVQSFLRIHNWYKIDDAWLTGARPAIEKISSSNDLFVCNSHAVPVMLYYIHRKGIALDLRKMDLVLPVLANDGFSFFISANDEQWNNSATKTYFQRYCSIVFQDKDFVVFDLKKDRTR